MCRPDAIFSLSMKRSRPRRTTRLVPVAPSMPRRRAEPASYLDSKTDGRAGVRGPGLEKRKTPAGRIADLGVGMRAGGHQTTSAAETNPPASVAVASLTADGRTEMHALAPPYRSTQI